KPLADKFLSHHFQNSRVRRAIPQMLLVQRIHQPAAHHHPPQSVRDVVHEGAVLWSGHLVRQRFQRTELWHAWEIFLLIRWDEILLPFLERRHFQLFSSRNFQPGGERNLIKSRHEFLLLRKQLFANGRKFHVVA